MIRNLRLVVLAFMLSSASANASTYLLHQKLTTPEGTAEHRFGTSVALAGDTALIGSQFSTDSDMRFGSAYLFDTNTGSLLHKLTAPDGTAGDSFGNSVALTVGTALVGSIWEGDNGSGSGSAYLFDTTTGSLLHKLTAPDGVADELFGVSVALMGDQALIGSIRDNIGSTPGSAYLFDTTTGSLLHKFTAPDGAELDWFGRSVALTGTTALVGSILGSNNGSLSGSAYLFDTTTGNLLHKFTAPDGDDFEFFGNTVALSGDTALVGSIFDGDNGSSSGSAYLFDTATGGLLHKLTAPDGIQGDRFGASVALSGDTALVGSLGLGDDERSGSAYMFDTATGSLLYKLNAPDTTTNDRFGLSVALTGDTAMIGSPLDDNNGMGSGAAYLFRIPEPGAGGLCLLGLLGWWPNRSSGSRS